jgi:hypothetical protein
VEKPIYKGVNVRITYVFKDMVGNYSKSNGYGSGYRYCSCGYPTDMVGEIVLLLSSGYGLSSFSWIILA